MEEVYKNGTMEIWDIDNNKNIKIETGYRIKYL